MKIKIIVAELLIICLIACEGLAVSAGSLNSSSSSSSDDKRNESDLNTIDSTSSNAESSEIENSAKSIILDNRKKNTDSGIADTNNQKPPSGDFSDNDFEHKEYLLENDIGDSLYYITVKNNSSANVSVNVSGIAYDDSNNKIGAAQTKIDVLGPDETSICYMYFDGVSGINHVDCSFKYNKETHYYPVISNIKLEQSINDKNVTIIATNEGEYNAQFVQAYALFFDSEDHLIGHDFNYIIDNDSEIKTGASISTQLDSYKDFDHVVCYLTGRSDGKSSKVPDGVSKDNFEVKEVVYDTALTSSDFTTQA